MQQGGVDVGDVVGVLDGVEAEFVGSAVDGGRLDTGAANQTVKAWGWWSRPVGKVSPARTSRPGVRPNSVPQTSRDVVGQPAASGPLSSPAIGRSTLAHDWACRSLSLGVRIPLAVVAGDRPGVNRTPRSARRRAASRRRP